MAEVCLLEARKRKKNKRKKDSCLIYFLASDAGFASFAFAIKQVHQCVCCDLVRKHLIFLLSQSVNVWSEERYHSSCLFLFGKKKSLEHHWWMLLLPFQQKKSSSWLSVAHYTTGVLYLLFVLWASLETGVHVVSFSEIFYQHASRGGKRMCIKSSLKKTEPLRLRVRTEQY